MSDALRAELARVASRLGADGVEFVLERPRDAGHGDLATNLAMVLAKRERANPRKTAERVLEELHLSPSLVERTEIAGPGFINFWLAQTQLAAGPPRDPRAGPAYGRSTSGAGLKVNIEFVSANPTGPLHVGHGRGAALGDAIGALLEWTGHAVTREFYINDAGVQIDRLAESLWARVRELAGHAAVIPEGGYHGEYLRDNARELVASRGRGLRRPAARRRHPAGPRARPADPAGGAGPRPRRLRRPVRRDVVRAGHLRLRPGPARARPARRAAGSPSRRRARSGSGRPTSATTRIGCSGSRTARFTYLVPDIAYHIDKHDRGFDRAIDVWGADHHGYIPRMRAVLQALGYPPEFFDVALVQLVKVVRGGEEVKMSKRSGEFVTLRDLYEEVGVDAARYFFLMRKGASPLDFDLDLAKQQTDENPVFYVQMAHARLSGIFRTAERSPESVTGELDLAALPAPQDAELLKKLVTFPEIVDKAAREREPHRITVFLHELATVVHGWYHHTRAVGAPEGPATEHARLLLARAARIVLANALTLLGISAPDRM